MRCKTKAFTLIELLVVIAIIAIVAAILFPVFAQAKGASKKTAAMSNLSQIAKGVQLYLGDSDDHLPPQHEAVPQWPGFDTLLIIVGDNEPTLVDTYEPYVKNKDVWFSPEDRLDKKGQTSFVFNGQLVYAWSMSAIPRPAEAIYMTDRSDIPSSLPGGKNLEDYAWWTFTQNLITSESQLPGTLEPTKVVTRISPNRYTGKVALYQFLDSHVKAMKFDQTWGDKSKNLHYATKL
ncbi:MAG: prepilin-type N-terminal cleavage/methylation domain-containing protein [Armatimonadetes bacterium]|nr:prepilin-type N-terminal cleavage/methylation domain-containing protein [Armatimonadota bacterium]